MDKEELYNKLWEAIFLLENNIDYQSDDNPLCKALGILEDLISKTTFINEIK